MNFTDQHKEEVERKIVEAIASAVEKKEIEESVLPDISEFVLDRIDKIQTQELLVEFLRLLSDKWSIFKGVFDLESGALRSLLDKKTADDVSQLANSGNIEEAIRIAKTATQQS